MTKPTKSPLCPAKTQINLGICPVWSQSSLWALCIAKYPVLLHADSRCPGWSESLLRTQYILLVLSWGGSNHICFSVSEASSMCMQILKALGRQGRCTGLPEPSLFGFVICAFVTWTSTVFPPYHSGGGTAVVETMRFPTKYMDDRDNIVLKKIGEKIIFYFVACYDI